MARHATKTSFQKGKSGNPSGRPVGSFSLSSILKTQLQKVPAGQQKSLAEALVISLLNKAINDGDHSSQKLIFNYIEGAPPSSLNIQSQTSSEGGVILLLYREFSV